MKYIVVYIYSIETDWIKSCNFLEIPLTELIKLLIEVPYTLKEKKTSYLQCAKDINLSWHTIIRYLTMAIT